MDTTIINALFVLIGVFITAEAPVASALISANHVGYAVWFLVIINLLYLAFITWIISCINKLGEENEQLKEGDGKQSSSMLGKNEYGIKIINPPLGQHIKSPFPIDIWGTYDKLPSGQEFWIVTCVNIKNVDGDYTNYYVQKKATAKNNEWNSVIYDCGEARSFKIAIVAAGKDGQALFEYFKKAGREYNKRMNSFCTSFVNKVEQVQGRSMIDKSEIIATVAKKAGLNYDIKENELSYWHPIKDLTNDIIFCEEVIYTLN